MGVDALDIKWRLEKKFNISIDNKEMVFIFNTPGKIHELIWQRLQGIHPACRSHPQELFAEVEAAVQKLPAARKRIFIFVKRTLERMIPPEDRVESWMQLSETLKCTLPPLDVRDPIIPRFPKECETPYALCTWVWQHHEDRLPIERQEFRELPPEGADRWTRESSWKAIQQIVADCICVDLDEVTPDARMIEDLGLE